SSSWLMLSAELSQAATAFDGVVTALASDEWTGPAAASMADAAAPFAAWMANAATGAEQTAMQLQAAAAALENVLMGVTPPPLIAENRALLAEATMMNILGQNNTVIAELEDQYTQMWGRNTQAIQQYAAASQQASKLTPFENAPQVVNQSGMSNQLAASAA